MKKRLFFTFGLLLLGGTLINCEHSSTDYAGYSYYVWVNDSDHPITLLVDEASFDDPDMPGYSKEEFEIVLEPGERQEETASGFVHSPYPEESLDTIKVSFADGAYEVIYGLPGTPAKYQTPSVNYNKPYNPTWEDNYVQEKVDRPNGCKKCEGIRWTYTFTNADYDAAKAIVDAQRTE